MRLRRPMATASHTKSACASQVISERCTAGQHPRAGSLCRIFARPPLTTRRRWLITHAAGASCRVPFVNEDEPAASPSLDYYLSSGDV